MLIKVFDMAVGVDCYIRPDAVTMIRVDGEKVLVHIGPDLLGISRADLDRLLAVINEQVVAGAAPVAAAAPVATDPPATMRVNLLSMTRDETRNSRSPFWRCGTEDGFMVNVFQHADPLKDNFNLFKKAGYEPEMLAMGYGETITWTRDSIYVELKQNGSFWNVVKVFERPPGALPDEPEPDDGAELGDESDDDDD